MIQVGLDLTPLVAGDTGVARYARELWWHLRADHDDLVLRTFALGRGRDSGVPVDLRVRIPLKVVHTGWRMARAPRVEQLCGPVDVVHSIDLLPPPSSQPVVMTTHDVLPIRRPELYTPHYVALAQRHAAALAHAAVVLATCEATAADVAEVAGVAPERIVVAPPGRRLLGGGGSRADATGAPAHDGPWEGPYVLYVGAITPRKGLAVLAEALRLLGSEAPTVLVAGPDGVRADEVRARVAAADVGHRLRFLGRVTDGVLDHLLSHATVLCHPSEAEGFGIPVLEAMGVGVPVVAGDIPSVREVGGDAVVLVPPRDPVALAEALAELLADPDRRAELAAAGRVRAEPYTWSAMAARIADVYRSLVP